MYVQVIDDLPGVDSLVDGEPVSAFSYAKLAGDPCTNPQNVSKQRLVLFGCARQVGHVFPRHYQDVDICERVDVVESKAPVIGINLGRWQFAVDYLAKQAVGLAELIFFFFCGPPHNTIPYKPMALASFAL